MPTKYGRDSSVEWADVGITPIRGLCPYIAETGGLEENGGCPYCFMKGFFKRFAHSKRPLNPELRTSDDMHWWPPKARKPLKVAVCLNLDLFHPNIPDDWIRCVIHLVRSRNYQQYPLTFIFLTKRPERYSDFEFPPNCWLGTTWDGLKYTEANIARLCLSADSNYRTLLVSFEPLLRKPPAGILSDSLACGLPIQWAIIGGDSRPGQPKPPDEWVDQLIEEARQIGAAVWVKDNYRYYKEVKEYPQERRF